MLLKEIIQTILTLGKKKITILYNCESRQTYIVNDQTDNKHEIMNWNKCGINQISLRYKDHTPWKLGEPSSCK